MNEKERLKAKKLVIPNVSDKNKPSGRLKKLSVSCMIVTDKDHFGGRYK
ncbi:hypothetical protein [Neobacillus massiliamazoniensis]|nr:hypothetical protein [Neobacillus massiliamazoniensis]